MVFPSSDVTCLAVVVVVCFVGPYIRSVSEGKRDEEIRGLGDYAGIPVKDITSQYSFHCTLPER